MKKTTFICFDELQTTLQTVITKQLQITRYDDYFIERSAFMWNIMYITQVGTADSLNEACDANEEAQNA